MTVTIICSCGNSNNADTISTEKPSPEATTEIVTVDQSFLNDLYDSLKNVGESAETNNCVLAKVEYDKLSSYKDKTFEDKNLSELAKSYIDALYKIIDSEQYQDPNYVKYTQLYYEKGEAKKYEIISKLIETKGFAIPNEYQQRWSLLEEDYNLVKNSKLLEVVDIKIVKEDYGSGYVNYFPIVKLKNNTNQVIDNGYIELQLKDKDRVATDDFQLYVKSLKPGQKAWTPQNGAVDSDYSKVKTIQIQRYFLYKGDFETEIASGSYLPMPTYSVKRVQIEEKKE